MRVLVVNPNARSDSYSGPNVFMDRLFSALSTTHEITILSGHRGAEDGRPWASLVVPVRIDPSERWDQAKWSLLASLWILRHARSFDVVHLHGCYTYNLLTGLAALVNGRRLVLVPLGEDADFHRVMKGSFISPARHVNRFVVAKASNGLSLSTGIAAEFRALGMPIDKISLLGNPVDVNHIKPPSPDLRWEGHTIGFLGVIGQRKRALLVLDVLADLRATFSQARALFVGPYSDTKFGDEFEKAVAAKGLADAVEVTGYQRDVAPFLKRMSVFVLPSSQEGLPGALVEAMAAGLPCLVTDVGAMGEVVSSSDCGAVLEAGRVDFTLAIGNLFRSPDQWQSMSANARTAAQQRFSIASVAKAYENATGVG